MQEVKSSLCRAGDGKNPEAEAESPRSGQENSLAGKRTFDALGRPI